MPLNEYPTGGDTAATEAPAAGPAHVTGGEFITPTLAELWPSPTNPRKRFDEGKLQQLADNIAVAGVHTPILIRPLPAKYMADTAGYRPRPAYEIVAGERRYRASRLAGTATVPALMRHLDDGQVLEIQLTENAQRDDLTALEEAAALARVLAETSIQKENLGQRIGKSRTHVYNRLKLLDLIPDGCAALNAGTLNASMGEYIARIPDAKLQARALEEALATDYEGVPRHSYDSFRKWVREHVMLPLGKARFKIADAALVPAAGACGECPNRTGANPDLFADVKGADICTNPTCYREKEAAHDAAIVAKAAERGQTVITGREAREVIPHQWNEDRGTLEGYKRLDKPDERTGSGKALKALLGDDAPAPVLVHSPHSGKLIEVLPTATVNQLLRDRELIDARQARAKRDISPAEREREEQEAFERKWRAAAIEQMHPVMLTGALPCDLPAPIARSIASMLLGGLTQDERGHIAKVLGLGKIAALDAITTHLAEAEHSALMAAVLVVLMEHDTRNVTSYGTGKPNPANRITAVADALDFDLRAVQRTVRGELDGRVKAPPATAADKPAVKYRDPMTGATWTGRGKKPKWVEVKLADGHSLEEFAQADLPLAPAAPARASRVAKPQRPAARAGGVAPGKAKTSAEEAMQGIAAAMQGIEASAPADARPELGAGVDAGGVNPGGADAPQGNEAGPVADALAPVAPTADGASPLPLGPQDSQAVIVDGALIDRAAALVVKDQKASVRQLKTGLRIGHDTARLVLGKLEARGVVGPCDERGTRKVLVTA